ncbi:ATP-binding protein [Sphingomonas hankookensis]
MGVFASLKTMFARLIDPPRHRPLRIERVVPFPPAAEPAAPVAQPDRRLRIHRGFAAALPVEDRFGLSGRTEEVDRMVRGVVWERKHVVVFGARGSGKTSLVRVFGDFADEVGQIVLYESTSGNIGFTDLFRPFLESLPGTGRDTALMQRLAALNDVAFGPRELATALGEVRQPTVLVLDEFDRIDDAAVQSEVAALMKLLSDMHARVQIVIVGIAANVDDLISGHPSLRRHMLVVPVGPIAADDLRTLLDSCADKCGMAFAPDAAAAVVHSAYGSPYHARLFGLEAALVADARGSDRIEAADVAQGFQRAFAGWADISGNDHRIFTRAIGEPATNDDLLRLVERTTLGQDTLDDAALARVMQQVGPALVTMAHGAVMFRDSLAPQFLGLMIEHGVGVRRIGGQ